MYSGDDQVNDQPGPDFVCIGAQKSGTTWLYENLAGHSEVWVPPVKEFHYFNRVCINEQLLGRWGIPHPDGIARYKSALMTFDIKRLRWLRQYYRLGLDKEWYLRLFDEKYTGGKVSGELTPGYSTLEERGVRYARSVLGKDVRILFIIRNPIYRSWSAAKMLMRYKDVTADSVSSEYLADILMSPHITLCSEYSKIIPLWRKYFENVYFLSYDQLCSAPREFLSEISRILDIRDKWDKHRIGKRVWADDKKIPIPPTIIKVLIAQYSREIEFLISMNECGYAESWYSEMKKLSASQA